MSAPPLWEHQTRAIGLASHRNDFALFFDPGCGKSRTMLEILRALCRSDGRVVNTLILAPPIVCSNWVNEFKKFTNIDEKKICHLSGPGSRRLSSLLSMRSKHPTGFVAITNYESLVSIKGLYDALISWAPEIIIYDESQKIKSFNSKRSLAAHKLSSRASRRYLLSGTPVLNSPMDLWSQYMALDKGKTFGNNFWGFRAKYFVDKNAHMPRNKHFPNWVVRPGSMEAFQELISATSLVVKKHECLDLPPLVRQTVEVGLSPQQRKAYDEMKKEFITFLDLGACTAQLAITKALRLQQIVSGHITVDDEDGTVAEFTHTPREEALKEQLETILENPEHKVLVWASWRPDYAVVERVCAELGVECVQVHGGVTAKNKEIAMDRFRTDPAVRVYIGHPGSGGIGVNLVEASYMIYYSRSFNLENVIQSEARNYRSGSERHNKVTRIDIVAKGTIDEEIQKALANKMAISEALLKSIKNVL